MNKRNVKLLSIALLVVVLLSVVGSASALHVTGGRNRIYPYSMDS